MKKTLSIIAAALAAFSINAQPKLTETIQMGVYFDEGQTSIPTNSKNLLEARIKTMLSNNTMCATDDFTQFIVTCEANKIGSDIVTGAPTKYRNEVEVTFYVIDVLAKKMFASEAVTVRGVGNSEGQSYTACFKQINTSHKALNTFFKNSAQKILTYYNEQYANIIIAAESLAKVGQYEEALLKLAMIPEACIGYNQAVDAAAGVYQKYLDHQAAMLISKATAIWNAGQDSASAYEVADLLCQISPDSKYWPEAQKLHGEIKTVVRDNINYDRRIQERLIDFEHTEKLQTIQAWRAVGVAYGNNQKSHTYHDAYVYR